jgi:hypothetical protein
MLVSALKKREFKAVSDWAEVTLAGVDIMGWVCRLSRESKRLVQN